MYELKEKINISLNWDGDEAYFGEQLEYDLKNNLSVEFFLEIEAKEKTLKSSDRDCPDDVEVVISHIAIRNIKLFNQEGDEYFPPDEVYEEIRNHLKEEIQF